MIDFGVDLRETAQHVVGRNSFLEGRVSFWIERFRVRHTTSHPEHNERVSGGIDFFLDVLGAEHGARIAGGQCRKSRSAGGFQKISTTELIHRLHWRSFLINISTETLVTWPLTTTNLLRLLFAAAGQVSRPLTASLSSSGDAPVPDDKAAPPNRNSKPVSSPAVSLRRVRPLLPMCRRWLIPELAVSSRLVNAK